MTDDPNKPAPDDPELDDSPPSDPVPTTEDDGSTTEPEA